MMQGPVRLDVGALNPAHDFADTREGSHDLGLIAHQRQLLRSDEVVVDHRDTAVGELIDDRGPRRS